MPTTLATPSPNNASMRFKEPFVSDGLNRKNAGVIPSGVIRGGLLETANLGLNVIILPDPVTGDSVYTHTNVNGRQITFRDVGARTLDLAAVASSTVFVCLFVDYNTGGPTVVEWRSYTQAELDALPEAPFLVIVGKVVVPGAGPIAASAVTPKGLRQAWANQAKGLRPWQQIVRNGSFLAGFSANVPAGEGIPHWKYKNLLGSPAASVSGTNPRTGGRSLEWTGTGITKSTFGVSDVVLGNRPSNQLVPVKEGQRVHALFYLAGTTIPAGASVKLEIVFHDEIEALLGTELIEDTVTTGTFAYKKVEGVIRVPADGYLSWTLTLEFTAGGPGTYFVDDVGIYLEPLGDTATSNPEPIAEQFEERAHQFAVVPDQHTVANLEERIDKTVRTRHAGVSGGQASIESKQADGAEAFLWKLLGQLDHSLLSKLVPFIKSDKTDSEVLLYEAPLDAVGGGNQLRIYARNVAGGDGGLEVTTNAFRDNLGFWHSDDNAVESTRFLVKPSGVYWEDKAPTAGAWVDGAWDGNAGAGTGDITKSLRFRNGVRVALESNNWERPAFETSFEKGSLAAFNYIGKFRYRTSPSRRARLYTQENQGFIITVNAFWDENTSRWNYDDSGDGAALWRFSPDDGVLARRRAGGGGAWTNDSAGWDLGNDFVIDASDAHFGYSSVRTVTAAIPLSHGMPDSAFLVFGGAGGTAAAWNYLQSSIPSVPSANGTWVARINEGVMYLPLPLPQAAELDRVRVVVNERTPGGHTGTKMTLNVKRYNLNVSSQTNDWDLLGSDSLNDNQDGVRTLSVSGIGSIVDYTSQLGGGRFVYVAEIVAGPDGGAFGAEDTIIAADVRYIYDQVRAEHG